MPPAMKTLARRLTTRLRAASTRLLTRRLEWMQPYPLGVRLLSVAILQRQAWGRLSREALKFRRDAAKDLVLVRAQQREWGRMWADVAALRDRLERSWTRPGDLPNWAAEREQLHDALVAQGMAAADAARAVARYAVASADDMTEPLDASLRRWGEELAVAATSRLRAMAAADVGDAVASFNEAHEGGEAGPRTPRRTPPGVAQATALLRDLHRASRSEPPRVLAATARSVETAAERLLAQFVRVAARELPASAAARRASGGERALAAADGIRQALLARSAARWAAWTAGWAEGSAYFAQWRQAARARPFPSAYRPPAATALSAVAADPARFDGEYLATKGWVSAVKVVHVGRKVLSSARLTSDRGASVQVGLPYIKLDSGGLVDGAYARLAGTFVRQHHDFDGPTLLVDRRELTADSRTSWLDWVTLELLPIATPVAHGLCGGWSWVPGTDGPGNPLRYGTWATGGSRRGAG